MGLYRCLCCMEEFDDSSTICPNCGHGIEEQQPQMSYLPMGTILDNKYIVGRALGGGKFSVTYLAWDYSQARKVVIKEYFPTSFASRAAGTSEVTTYDGEKSKQFEAGLVSFIEEGTKLTQLSATLEGIVRTDNVIIENSTAYVVMEYLDGFSLDRIVSMDKMPYQDVIQLMTPVLMSLSTIHKNGLISYNISPDNIIMTRDNRVMLLGFGSAKLDTAGFNKDINIVTKKGFSAEELYRSNAKDVAGPASDVYSIAAVIYYAITGQMPVSSVERGGKNDIAPPSELGINIPENVENALMNALNVDAQYRTPTCDMFLQELNSPRVKRIVEPKRKVDNGKWSKKMKAIVSTAVIVVAIIIAVLVAFIVKNQSTSAKLTPDAKFPIVNGLTLDEANNQLSELAGNDIEFVDDKDYIPTDDKEMNNTIVSDSQEIKDCKIEDALNNKDLEEKDGKKQVRVKLYKLQIEVPANTELTGEKEAVKQKLTDLGFTNVEYKKLENSKDKKSNNTVKSVSSAGKTIYYDDEITIEYYGEYVAPPTTKQKTTRQKQSNNTGNGSGKKTTKKNNKPATTTKSQNPATTKSHKQDPPQKPEVTKPNEKVND